jgi:hypothetical protein
MMYGIRGMGTADVPEGAGVCNSRFGGFFPTCWDWLHEVVYGDKYPAPPSPPAVGSTLSSGAQIPAVPPDAASPQLVGVNAGQIVQDITDQQVSDWQAQNQQFFENLNDQVNPPGSEGTNWWLIGGLAAGVFLMGSMISGGRR